MTVSRGEHYEDYVKLYAEKVEKKLIQKQQVAKLLEVSNTIVTKMHEAYKVDKANLKKAEDWETPKEALASLRKFEDFRDRYFRTETGEKYETADFHQKWINAILTAIDEGNEQMILSPPRHGKTDLLTHFAVWQICKNPNVRIMWVGGNEEIAKNAVGSVLDHLEHNQKLIEDFCIPGQTFKPKNRFNIVEEINFPDHFNYSKNDIYKILEIAKNKDAKILTTEKDYVKIQNENKDNINFIKIDLEFLDQKEFIMFIKSKLNEKN